MLTLRTNAMYCWGKLSICVSCWQGVSVIVKTHTADNPVVADITLSTEVGMMGSHRSMSTC